MPVTTEARIVRIQAGFVNGLDLRNGGSFDSSWNKALVGMPPKVALSAERPLFLALDAS
jgi:hypothetical protein